MGSGNDLPLVFKSRLKFGKNVVARVRQSGLLVAGIAFLAWNYISGPILVMNKLSQLFSATSKKATFFPGALNYFLNYVAQ